MFIKIDNKIFNTAEIIGYVTHRGTVVRRANGEKQRNMHLLLKYGHRMEILLPPAQMVLFIEKLEELLKVKKDWLKFETKA